MAEITVREALNSALDEELARDRKVFIIGEEVGHYNGAYKVTQGLLDKYGDERLIDTPIAEEGFAAIGIGAALTGLRPIVEFMTWNFSLVALDQIVNNAAKLRSMSGGELTLPMVFRGPQGAGGALAAQHSQVFENYYTYVPGLKVICPSTPKDMKGLLKSAIRDDDPVIFIESEKMYNYKGEVPEEEYLIPIGEGEVKRNGEHISVVCWGMMLYPVMQAAEELVKDGIEIEIIDPRTLRPLDEPMIAESVKRTNRLLIVQEAWPNSSFGAYIASRMQKKVFDYLDAPIEILSAEDVPMPYSFPLEDAVLPSSAKVTAIVKRMLK
ncbi:MAG: alpha-ketoacid dehydrogenase subunit beta [Leptospiraceae bacterium]|nr:alpha-ketoacid dehydrogenase subunit beta [Leptospiraceae bacterium]